MGKNLAWIALVAVVLAIYIFKEVWTGSGGTGPHDRVLTDFYMIRAGLQTYKMNAGHYPTTEQGLEALAKRPASNPQPKQWKKLFDSVPIDPWGHPYRYRSLSGNEPEEFEIICRGKDGQFGTEDDRSSLKELP